MIDKKYFFDSSLFSNGLTTDSLGRDLELFDQLDSTNDEVFKILTENHDREVTVIAENQLKGRGRRGNSWVSSRDNSLTFSFNHIFLADSAIKDNRSVISLAVAVAIIKAVTSFVEISDNREKIKIKYPNDILIDGKKAAGILAEARTINNREQVIIGVGLNIKNPPVLPDQRETASISEIINLSRFSVPIMLAIFFNEMEKLLMVLNQSGFFPIRGIYKRFDATSGRSVILTKGGVESRFKVEDIDKDGYLVLIGSDGEKTRHNSGELVFG